MIINIAILFYRDSEFVDKDNLFIFTNIKVEQETEMYGDKVLILPEIKNIKPVNFQSYVPPSGYQFQVYKNKLDQLKLNFVCRRLNLL